jgi:hypothetical protein
VTLIELLLGIIVSACVLAGMTYWFKSSMGSVMIQKRKLGTQYTAGNVAEMIALAVREAGSDVPGDNVIKSSATGDTVTILANPRGAYYRIKKNIAANEDTVDNPALFSGLTGIKLKRAGTGAVEDVTLLSVDVANKVLRFSTMMTLFKGDELYAQDVNKFARDPATGTVFLTINGTSEVLAENIQRLKIAFYDFSGAAQTSWDKMDLCSLTVVARSRPNSVDSLAVRRNVILRNKL